MQKLTPKDLANTRERHQPTLGEALVFRAKATLLQITRGVRECLSDEVVRYPWADPLFSETVVGQSKTPLWTTGDAAEQYLLAGKIHNLRIAIRELNNLVVPAGRVFSFWRHVGRPGKRRGYVAGRELREGCLIETIGGGLCQLSNALYDAGLNAGFEIVERHAHTQIIPGSLAEIGRDATVFWNYVDLRFKSSDAFRIEAVMTADFLIVRMMSRTTNRVQHMERPVKKSLTVANSVAPQSCTTCNVSDCFRHKEHTSSAGFGRAAFLVDEFYPEFDRYISTNRCGKDLLALPLDGKRFRRANYAWTTESFRDIRQSRLLTLLRSYKSRRLVMQGAERQRALLASSEKLAESYATFLDYETTHVVVMQNLLPFLWREGHLGGRTFDVMMTALPLARLHERLDMSFALHPESKTLGDFRADPRLVQNETEALRHARKIITPHTEIAALYPEKAILVDWVMPREKFSNTRTRTYGAKIVFAGPTVGRKGAYELRTALQGLDLELITVGAQLEGADFWRGLRTEKKSFSEDWLDGVQAVILPAFVEHRPRRLLEAIARGIPVIASDACGLGNVQGVTNIPIGDVRVLRHEIEKLIFAA